MKYDDIKPYIEKGLISEQAHPEDENVRIFNYTQTCQFQQAWDDITRQYRGLIMNVATGEILARPFPKFFNYGEHVSKGWAIPTTKPEIYEKLDGSLGIMYTLKDKTWIATRGSFTSEQAIWATKWWRENKGDEPYGNAVTHLFEIIYPENRIVVTYDYSGLVHLASLDTQTGKAVDAIMPVRRAQRYDNVTIEQLLQLDKANEEGFVVFYPEENVRMKIKFPEYVRLHRIATGVSEIAIWEMLRDEKPLTELLEKVPDEFYNWVEKVVASMLDKYNGICKEAFGDFNKIIQELNIDVMKIRYIPLTPLERKEFALRASKTRYPDILFALIDDKKHAPLVWKMIRPHGARPFKNDIDA